jgi:hypothetical protein
LPPAETPPYGETAIANLVDLSAIASVGSAIALAVFVLVALAG